MKYKDNKFVNYQDKQRNGEIGGYWSERSDRQIRRELENRLSLFYQQNLLNKVEKEWWINLSISDKQEIETSFACQQSMIGSEFDIWGNFEWFDTWEEWFENISKKFKPDMVKYREAKLKKIGI